ncbi:MAG: hypothetical protein DMD56_10820 [Gemmatimonadetes bacterium]|nr:MAG: hypothetical protein DMD56_10820 [Gemmatimonadota bacterium]
MTEPQTPYVEPERPPYLLAGLVTLGALVLYVATLAPTTQFWDTSEYIAAAHVLGIPHPPGNPLFVLIAHTWGLLPLAAGYATRINLLAAVTSAIAAGSWFLVSERWMRAWVPARLPRRLAALAGALVAATAFTVWNQSVVNEKVYTLSLLSIALALWLIVRWDDQPAGEGHDHHLLMIVFLLALTSTNHMMGVLVGPAVVVLLCRSTSSSRSARRTSRRSTKASRRHCRRCGTYSRDSSTASRRCGSGKRRSRRSWGCGSSTSAGSGDVIFPAPCRPGSRWCSGRSACSARCATGWLTAAGRSR